MGRRGRLPAQVTARPRAVQVGGRQLLASASDDETVRVWDPVTGACTLTIPVHHSALAVVWVRGRLAVGLSVGILVADLHVSADRQMHHDHDLLPNRSQNRTPS